MIDALDGLDFATFCADILGEPISPAWIVFFKAVEGLPLTPWEESLYCACTGRVSYTPRTLIEATGICGRRSEKTQTALKFLLYKIFTSSWETQARATWLNRIVSFTRRRRLLHVPIIAQDMRIARIIKLSGEQLVMDSPFLSRAVADIRSNEIEFKNGICLTVFPASRASVRGLTCPAALVDEMAWITIEGADEKELLRQLRPSMIQFGQTRRLLKMSTPWQSKSGLLVEEYRRRLERDDLLCWQAATDVMTPRIDEAELAREKELDPVYYAREYGAEFVDDLESFLPQEDIDAAIANWKELPPDASEDAYHVAALDASSVTGGDRFTFGIYGPRGVHVLRGWRKAPVAVVLDEVAKLAKEYRIEKILCDQYSFAFVEQLFAERGVELAELPFSARTKFEIYFALKAALARRDFPIPDVPEAIRELRMLESERRGGGTYKIGGPRNQTDDYATVLALLAHKVQVSAEQSLQLQFVSLVPPEPKPKPEGYIMNKEELAAYWAFEDSFYDGSRRPELGLLARGGRKRASFH